MVFSQARQECILGNGHCLNLPFRVNWGGGFSRSHFIFIGQMDALLKGGTML